VVRRGLVGLVPIVRVASVVAVVAIRIRSRSSRFFEIVRGDCLGSSSGELLNEVGGLF
jgi:hypothetical protein